MRIQTLEMWARSKPDGLTIHLDVADGTPRAFGSLAALIDKIRMGWDVKRSDLIAVIHHPDMTEELLMVGVLVNPEMVGNHKLVDAAITTDVIRRMPTMAVNTLLPRLKTYVAAVFDGPGNQAIFADDKLRFVFEKSAQLITLFQGDPGTAMENGHRMFDLRATGVEIRALCHGGEEDILRATQHTTLEDVMTFRPDWHTLVIRRPTKDAFVIGMKGYPTEFDIYDSSVLFRGEDRFQTAHKVALALNKKELETVGSLFNDESSWETDSYHPCCPGCILARINNERSVLFGDEIRSAVIEAQRPSAST